MLKMIFSGRENNISSAGEKNGFSKGKFETNILVQK